jgi:hypothetical protein
MRASEQYHPKEVPSPGSTVLPLPPTLADSIAQYLEVDNVAQRFEQSVSASKVARGERYFFKIASGVAGFRLRQQGLWLLRHRETLPNCIPKVRKLAWAIDHAALIIDLIRGPTMQEALLARSPSEAATLSQRCFDTLQRSFYRERSLAGCEMMQRIADRTLKRLTANYLWSDYRLQSALYDDTILIGNRLVHGCTVSLHSIVNSIGQLSFRGPVASLIHGDPHFGDVPKSVERMS